MSGASIASEVNSALAEVARDVGSGTFQVTLLEPAAQPVNPWDSPAGSPVEHQVNAIVSDYRERLIDGEMIQRGDKRILLSATGVIPKTNWRLIANGINYAIINVSNKQPSGVSVFVVVQARV